MSAFGFIRRVIDRGYDEHWSVKLAHAWCNRCGFDSDTREALVNAAALVGGGE